MFKAAAIKVAAANAAERAKEDKADGKLARYPANPEPKRIRFKADIERGVVLTIFERNGWVRTEGDDWQVGWFNVGNIRAMVR